MLIAVWAMDENQLIGNSKQGLPWDNQEDLAWFKQITLHQNILLGRKTFMNLPIKPLPNRFTYLLTKQKKFQYNNDNVSVEHNFLKLIQKFQSSSHQDLYICGGAEIYKLCWPYLDQLIVSCIPGQYSGDIYFPKCSWNNFKLNHQVQHKTFTVKFYKRIFITNN